MQEQQEQDATPTALATLEESVPYGDLKRLIQEEQGRVARRDEAAQSSRRSSTKLEARPSHRYGLD